MMLRALTMLMVFVLGEVVPLTEPAVSTGTLMTKQGGDRKMIPTNRRSRFQNFIAFSNPSSRKT
jgi:hypothetical protein